MRRRWLPIVATLLIFPAAGLTWHLARGPSPPWHSASPAPATQSVPATIGTAERKDVPVYLTGLGTVQAFNTVTVKAGRWRMERSRSPKARMSKRAMSWRRSIRVRSRPRSIRRGDQGQGSKPTRQRKTRPAALPEGRAAAPTAAADRHAGALGAQLEARSRPIRRMSTARRRSSTTRRSARRLPAGPASGWSTRATSCMRPIATGLVVVTQLQPISVGLHLAAGSAAAVIHAGLEIVTAQGLR